MMMLKIAAGLQKVNVAIDVYVQGVSNMTGTDYTLFTHKSVPVIFEPPCMSFVCRKAQTCISLYCKYKF
jgi:hypothetical protein